MMDSLLPQVLVNGLILSIVLSAIILASLMYNARLWLQDYPKPIQEKVPPLSSAEKRQRFILSLLVMGVLFGGVLLQTAHLRTLELSFGAAYLSVFLLLLVFNLFDALVLDLFILTLLKPRFVIFPGMEGMEHLLNDYRKQGIDFLKGMAFCGVASLLFAALAVL